VLLFGGPYGNLEATEALLDEAERRRIPPRRMICTGDIAAYAADPQGVADLLRREGVPVVMGNCEESLGLDAEACSCGFEEGTACERLAVAWYAYCRSALDGAARAWMRTLPRALVFEMAGRRFRVVHGSVMRINAFVFASTPEPEKADGIGRAGADAIVAGHSGIPFTQLLEGGLWHNPGVVGLPANDGTPRVWFSVVEPRAGAMRIEHVPLAYDHARAANKMRAAGLPAGYAAALETGLWPSLDVLPPEEVALRGKAIRAAALDWPLSRAPSLPARSRKSAATTSSSSSGSRSRA
jgi:predicted phosphodiesterase